MPCSSECYPGQWEPYPNDGKGNEIEQWKHKHNQRTTKHTSYPENHSYNSHFYFPLGT